MNNKRIYPELSKEELDKQWKELFKKYEKEGGTNFGEIDYLKNYHTLKGLLLSLIIY